MLRDYEVSIWTLQDGFITVLKGFNLESKGQIQNPMMTLNVDGTNEFSFSIPMYIYEGPERKENPRWYNVRNGNIVANMRKIKVIFNKKTEIERVFEFLITKVTERHERNELYCDVECEGLAFHELGKIGYKIELNQDDFIEEWNAWATESYENEAEHAAREPKNNINYWLDKIFKNTKWHYSIYMDWAAYDGLVTIRYEFPSSRIDLAQIDISRIWDSEEFKDLIVPYIDLTPEERVQIDTWRFNLGLRMNTKIYEDEYVSSWTVGENGLTPARTEPFREKLRLLNEKESNIYNLTQAIAEAFGVYCRYEYHYDDHYHIIGREIIFYNNYLEEMTGTIDITYPYDTANITREMDSTDIITKMFIKSIDDSGNTAGLATIMDTDSNRSREDYILNFDYLYSIGTITQQQYDEIPAYETRMHNLNLQILPYESQLMALQNEYTDISAKEAFARNAMSLDDERISATDDLLNAITEGTGRISVTTARPDICYIIEDSQHPGAYCINIRQAGIIGTTVHIYKTYTTTNQTLSNEIKGFNFEIDEFNNLTGKVFNMPAPSGAAAVYVIYDYEPKLYYENIKRIWIQRKNADTAEYNRQRARAEELDGKKDANGNRITDGKIQETEKKLEEIRQQKAIEIAKFEKMMGPALREGYWQPEDDYTNYGDKYSQPLQLTNTSVFNEGLASIGWDNNLFEDEQKNYYELGPEQTKMYYPCIDLSKYIGRFTNSEIAARTDEKNLTIESLSFIFQDLAYESIENPSYFRYMPVDSQCCFTFIRKKGTNNVIPVLMITGIEDLPDDTDITNKARIGYLKTTVQAGGTITNVVKDIVSQAEISWILTEDLENYEIVYPRIKINDGNVKNNNDELSILINNSLLSNYEDYYVMSRGDTTMADEQEQFALHYYITIKPNTVFRNGAINALYRCNYTISNTGLIIYLDSIQVLNENSVPKVTYTVDPSFVNTSFIEQAYNCLSKIVRINDSDLKFENVRGYISELRLDLDHPQEDEITINNYKTKFEDLFSNIVAQTEEMQKNNYVIGRAAQIFTATGGLSKEVLQNTLFNVDLQYAFNQGKLTIDEQNGIWGTSDDGVVAFRGGGIFTATNKDEDGNWIWNTGILPSGINASLITSGQLDTNLIRIYAGNNLKLQMNADGLFAYKSWLEDNPTTGAAQTIRQAEYEKNSLNAGQYVVHNSEGLFLKAKAGAKVLNAKGDNYITLSQDIDRVAISWDGFTIRNWNNEKVFYADENGNLTLSGTIYAKDGEFTGRIHARSLLIGDSAESETSINDFVDEKVDASATTLRHDFEVSDGELRSSIEKTQKYAEGVSEESHSLFDQTAERITTEVEKITEDVNGKYEETKSSIKQADDRITTEVEKITKDINGKYEETKSSIKQTNDKITTEVEKITTWQSGAETTMENLSTQIETTAEGITTNITKEITGPNGRLTKAESSITATASSLNSTITDVTKLSGRMTTAESQISQNAENIKLKVTADDVHSLIEMDAQSIRLKTTKLAWQAANSIMTDDGVLWAQGASINGIIAAYQTTGSTITKWVELKQAQVLGGYAGILESTFLEKKDLETYGLQVRLNLNASNGSENGLEIQANNIFVRQSAGGIMYKGYTGKFFGTQFINGICVDFGDSHSNYEAGTTQQVIIEGNAYTTFSVTFSSEFKTPPIVVASLDKESSQDFSYRYGGCSVVIESDTITTKGFSGAICNYTSYDKKFTVTWIALEKTAKTRFNYPKSYESNPTLKNAGVRIIQSWSNIDPAHSAGAQYSTYYAKKVFDGSTRISGSWVSLSNSGILGIELERELTDISIQISSANSKADGCPLSVTSALCSDLSWATISGGTKSDVNCVIDHTGNVICTINHGNTIASKYILLSFPDCDRGTTGRLAVGEISISGIGTT